MMSNTENKKTIKKQDGKCIKAKRICLIVCYAIWFAINLMICIKHEAFRDEAQSWFIAKDNSIPGMIEFMWQEGHPWLFHLILWPFAHIGVPFTCMRYICFAIAASAVYLYINKSPFPASVTCATLLLPFINYYSTAFARPYCLLLLGCVLVGASWKGRKRRPWLTGLSIALLGCSHIMCVIPSLLLFIYLIAQNASKKAPTLSGCLAYIIPMFVFYIPLAPQILRVFESFGLPAWTLIPCLCVGVAVIAGSILLVKFRLDKRKNHSINRHQIHSVIMSFIIAITAIATCFLLTAITDTAIMTVRYMYSSIPMFLTGMWIMHEEQVESYGSKPITTSSKIQSGIISGGIVFICAISCILGLYKEMMYDVKYPYSTGKATADFINDNLDDNAVILAGHQGMDTTVALYLDGEHHLTVPQTGSVLHYTKWFDEWEKTVPQAKWKPILNEYAKNHENVYLLVGGGCDYEEFYGWMFDRINAGDISIVYTTYPLDAKDRVVAVDMAETYILLKFNRRSFDE